MLKKIGMNKMLEGADRLNRYMQSVDEDLKKIGEAFNANTKVIAAKLDAIEAKLDKLGGQDEPNKEGTAETADQ